MTGLLSKLREFTATKMKSFNPKKAITYSLLFIIYLVFCKVTVWYETKQLQNKIDNAFGNAVYQTQPTIFKKLAIPTFGENNPKAYKEHTNDFKITTTKGTIFIPRSRYFPDTYQEFIQNAYESMLLENNLYKLSVTDSLFTEHLSKLGITGDIAICLVHKPLWEIHLGDSIEQNRAARIYTNDSTFRQTATTIATATLSIGIDNEAQIYGFITPSWKTWFIYRSLLLGLIIFAIATTVWILWQSRKNKNTLSENLEETTNVFPENPEGSIIIINEKIYLNVNSRVLSCDGKSIKLQPEDASIFIVLLKNAPHYQCSILKIKNEIMAKRIAKSTTGAYNNIIYRLKHINELNPDLRIINDYNNDTLWIKGIYKVECKYGHRVSD